MTAGLGKRVLDPFEKDEKSVSTKAEKFSEEIADDGKFPEDRAGDSGCNHPHILFLQVFSMSGNGKTKTEDRPEQDKG